MQIIDRVVRTLVPAGIAAILTLGLVAPATATVVRTLDDTLTGTIGSLSLHSEVSAAGSVYTYAYTLTYISGGPTAHIFSIENQDDLAFDSAFNTNTFKNPSYSPGWYEVKWVNGILNVGQTVTFGYSSSNLYSEIPISAYAMDGGTSAAGHALGMAGLIPEPSTFAGLALAIAGMFPKLLRSRRK